eukprot:scaffold35276_cov17-Prasinocladus_malaysianus.AAC.1
MIASTAPVAESSGTPLRWSDSIQAVRITGFTYVKSLILRHITYAGFEGKLYVLCVFITTIATIAELSPDLLRDLRLMWAEAWRGQEKCKCLDENESCEVLSRSWWSRRGSPDRRRHVAHMDEESHGLFEVLTTPKAISYICSRMLSQGLRSPDRTVGVLMSLCSHHGRVETCLGQKFYDITTISELPYVCNLSSGWSGGQPS